MILKDRLLFQDGTTVVNDELAMELIFEEGKLPEGVMLYPSEDAEKYAYKYVTPVIYDSTAEHPLPEPEFIETYDFVALANEIYASKPDDVSDEDHIARLDMEMDFFIRSKNEQLLCTVKNLLDKLREDGLVWGGRGSSCASYVLHLIGVHAVNPIKYDIPFSEFSKEK